MEERKYISPEEKLKPKTILRESDTRIIIDRKLRESGWDIEDKNQLVTEEPTKTGRVDYLLKDRRSRPLSIIEAKRFSIDPEAAKQQALEYSEELKTGGCPTIRLQGVLKEFRNFFSTRKNLKNYYEVSKK